MWSRGSGGHAVARPLTSTIAVTRSERCHIRIRSTRRLSGSASWTKACQRWAVSAERLLSGPYHLERVRARAAYGVRPRASEASVAASGRLRMRVAWVSRPTQATNVGVSPSTRSSPVCALGCPNRLSLSGCQQDGMYARTSAASRARHQQLRVPSSLARLLAWLGLGSARRVGCGLCHLSSLPPSRHSLRRPLILVFCVLAGSRHCRS